MTAAVKDIPLIGKAGSAAGAGSERFSPTAIESETGVAPIVRKLIAFDDDTFDKLRQLGRDRMATIQELADEAFADLLKKHGIPFDLKDALRRSAAPAKTAVKRVAKSSPARKNRS